MNLLYIGSGPISNFHIPALKKVGFNICKIASRPNSERCESFARKHGLINEYDKKGWENAIQDKTFNCAVVAIDTKFTPKILTNPLSLD